MSKRKFGKALLASSILVFSALGVCTITSCGETEEPDNPDTPDDPVTEVTYTSISITNKEELTAEWREYSDDREVSLSVTQSEGTANISQLIADGKLTITSSDTTVVTVMGKKLHAVKAGSATITVKVGDVSDTVTVTVSEIEFTTLSEVAKLATTTATTYNVKGVVSTLTSNGFILDDGETALLIYGATASSLGVEKGDYVALSCAVYRYHDDSTVEGSGILESSSTTLISVLDESAPQTLLEKGATDLDTTESTITWASQNSLIPVSFTALAQYYGTYKAFYIGNDTTTTPFEPSSIPDEITVDCDNGVTYDVVGYAVYDAKYKYVAVYLDSLDETEMSFTGLSLNKESATLYIEGTSSTSVELTAKTTGINSHKAELTWTSSNTSVATVDAGVVKAVAEGTSTITVSYGEYSATCEVTVKTATAKVSGVTLSKETLTGYVGISKTLTATVAGEAETGFIDEVTWSSSDTSVATVSETGEVTFVKVGTATITATSVGTKSDGTYATATCAVEVKETSYGTEESPLTLAELNEEAEAICEKSQGSYSSQMVYVRGKVTKVVSYTSNYTITLCDENDSTISWTSSYTLYSDSVTNVAVNDIVVIKGYVEYYKSYCIYYKTKSDTSTYPSVISRTVGESTITLKDSSEGTYGTVTVKNGDTEITSGTKVTNDTSLTLTVTPNTGYKLSALTVGGSDVTSSLTSESTYTFTVAGDTEIAYTFVDENAAVASTMTWEASSETMSDWPTAASTTESEGTTTFNKQTVTLGLVGIKNNTSYIMLSSKSLGTCYLYNKTALNVKNIVSITITTGSSASAAALYDISFGTSALSAATTAEGTNVGTGASQKFTNTSVSDATYFQIASTGSKNGQVAKIEIEYTPVE